MQDHELSFTRPINIFFLMLPCRHQCRFFNGNVALFAHSERFFRGINGGYCRHKCFGKSLAFIMGSFG